MWVLSHYSVRCHLECMLLRVGCAYVVHQEQIYYFVMQILLFYCGIKTEFKRCFSAWCKSAREIPT